MRATRFPKFRASLKLVQLCVRLFISDMTSSDFETHTRHDVRIPEHVKLNVPDNSIQ